MIRTKKAIKVLGKKQQKHLTEMNTHSMKTFISTRKLQRQMEQEVREFNKRLDIESNPVSCSECNDIARRLEVD